jgi:hypothetical protein
MSGLLKCVTVILALAVSVAVSAQSSGRQLIDEFGKLDSEDIQVRLKRAMIQLANYLEGHPDSKLEFILHRVAGQPIGEPYRAFGIQKAFFAAEHYDTKRIVWTICGPVSETYIQVWLIDSLAQRHTCSPEDPKLNQATLFTTLVAPNPKYEIGSCCIIDEVKYAATMETIKEFAHFVNRLPQTTVYVVVYGGTNVYGTRVSPGSEKNG